MSMYISQALAMASVSWRKKTCYKLLGTSDMAVVGLCFEILTAIETVNCNKIETTGTTKCHHLVESRFISKCPQQKHILKTAPFTLGKERCQI